MEENALSAPFNPTSVDESGWFHARKLVENHDRNIIDGIVWFLSSLNSDDLEHAQNLFDNYDLKTVRGIFEFLSPPRRDSTATLRTIASSSSNAWTISSSSSSIFSEASRTSFDSGLSVKSLSASSALAKARGVKPSSKSDYPCFCTFHQESGDPKAPLNRKSDWKRHEDDFHNSNESWHCRWCSDRFLSFRALEAHCKKLKDHPKILSKNELFCQRFLTRVRYACGFRDCRYHGLFHTWDKRCDHLAEHMKDYERGEEQWAPEQWTFSTRLRRLLNQPEVEGYWRDTMILHHGPNEAMWPAFWKFNERSQTLAHKLECRDFRPSPKEVAECAVYLAWMSADGNAPDTSRLDNVMRKVLRPPTLESLPSRRGSRDLEVALKRFSEAQLRSPAPSMLAAPQKPAVPTLAFSPAPYDGLSVFPAELSSPQAFGMGAAFDPQFDFHSDQNLLNNLYLTSKDDPEEEGPHPGNLWVPSQEVPSWLQDSAMPGAASMDAMEIDIFGSSAAHPLSFIPERTIQPPPPPPQQQQQPQHRRPSQILRQVAGSLPLSHRRPSSG